MTFRDVHLSARSSDIDGGGASGSSICFLLGVPSAKWTEIDEGELKNACFQSRKILVLNFMFIFSSLRVSFLLLDWRMITRKESTKYFIRQTKQVGGVRNSKTI